MTARRRLAALLACLSLPAALASAPPARAAMGPCVPGDAGGPRCHVWTARVTSIDDGDTLSADIDGDGTHRAYVTRFTAVQAMELTVHSVTHPSRRRGFCNAIDATNRLTQLVRRSHDRVRLSAQDPAARADVRLQRSIAVKVGGRWRDAGEILIREGHAMWLPIATEDAWNERYLKAEQQAQQAGRYLWDTTHCGAGPQQDARLQVWPMWNPLGFDPGNLAGEYMVVRNTGTSAVSLGGWWVRDSTNARYRFAKGTSLAPGESLTLHTGSGTDRPGDLHRRLGEPIFENPDDPRHLGDGVYLFDPQGDVRAWLSYPCRFACADPLQGALTLAVHERAPESFTVRNVSAAPADLFGYAIALPGSWYAFPEGTVVAPGGTLRVDVAGDWGVRRYMLPDAGGSARLASFADVTLACAAWGSGRC